MTLGVWRTYGAGDCFSFLTHRFRGWLTCAAPLAVRIQETGKKQIPHTARKGRDRVRSRRSVRDANNADDSDGPDELGGTIETVP
jgi:hypothetical protein